MYAEVIADLYAAGGDVGRALCRWALAGAASASLGYFSLTVPLPPDEPRRCADCQAPLGPRKRGAFCDRCRNRRYNARRYQAQKPPCPQCGQAMDPHATRCAACRRRAERPWRAPVGSAAGEPARAILPTPICPECGQPALVFADFGARCAACADARDRKQRGRAPEPPALRVVS